SRIVSWARLQSKMTPHVAGRDFVLPAEQRVRGARMHAEAVEIVHGAPAAHERDERRHERSMHDREAPGDHVHLDAGTLAEQVIAESNRRYELIAIRIVADHHAIETCEREVLAAVVAQRDPDTLEKSLGLAWRGDERRRGESERVLLSALEHREIGRHDRSG